jgi:hypothetical protein
MGLRTSRTLQPVAACLMATAWFLWPFTSLSWAELAYAVLAGSGLLLISRGLALLLLPSRSQGLMVQVLALFMTALVVGLACSLGLWLAEDSRGTVSVLHELWARSLDALACAIAGLILFLPRARA